MPKLAIFVLLSVFLFWIALAASAQEPDPNWNKVPDQEPPEQAKLEAEKPDTKASAGDLAKATQNPVASLVSHHPAGRPSVSGEVAELIRRISLANPRWGAPRIHGELLKLGIQLSQAAVAKYMARHRKPPSQHWRTFLKNHMQTLVSADFFVVPTITFRVLFVLVILSHDRRRPIHFAVTAHPTSEWTARQLLEAFPWDSAPRYLLRDRDGVYGEKFHEATEWLGIREVLTAPKSSWQNPYVERLIGSIRRECLDHVIVLNETSLHRVLRSYFEYYERTRTHLSQWRSLIRDGIVLGPLLLSKCQHHQ